MLIAYNNNFIFIHMFKVAGTSMRYVFKKYMFPPYESSEIKDLQRAGKLASSRNYRDHITAKELRSTLGTEIFGSSQFSMLK